MNHSKAKKVFPLNRLAVLASGRGSTFEAIAKAVQNGEIKADYLVLVTDNPKAGVVDRARRLGVETVAVDWETYGNKAEHDQALATALVKRWVGLVFLAGYLRKVGPQTLGRYRHRALNTHPALLPDNPKKRRYGGERMFGSRVHEAVWQAGETVSGATVHLVDAEFDHGKVLRRVEVDISRARNAGEVAELVQQQEKPLAVGVIRDVINGTLPLQRD